MCVYLNFHVFFPDDMETIPQEEIVQCIAGIDEEQAKECLNKMKNDLIQATILAEGRQIAFSFNEYNESCR